MLSNQQAQSNKFQIHSKYLALFCSIACIQIFSVVPVKNRPSSRSKESESTWIGDAYVVSTKLHIPDDVMFSAKACGFLPQKLPPKLPFGEHYEFNKNVMYKSCFGVAGRTLLPFESSKYAQHTSLAEISLICSHRYALDLIAHDSTMQDSDWALIIEDDAVLNPQVGHENARLYSLEAIKAARLQHPVEGFIYFGICGEGCSQKDSVLVNDSFSIGKYCSGFCTHAYAVTKYTAKFLFPDVYNNVFMKSRTLQIDQAYQEYFSTKRSRISAMVAGVNFHSPDEFSHTGLLYQCNRTSNVKVTGTALASNVFRPQTCFIVHSDGTTVRQLLQHYVSLVSMCLLRQVDPHQCASFAAGKNNKRFFNKFSNAFRMRKVTCVYNNAAVTLDHSILQQQNLSHNLIANISYGSALSLELVDKLPLVPGAESFVRELLKIASPNIEKRLPTLNGFDWLSSSSLSLINPILCAPDATDVCVHLSVDRSFNVDSLRRYFSSAVHSLSQRYTRGVAMKFIVDKAVQDSQLKALVPRSHSNIESPICVRALTRYDGYASDNDHDIWTIRQLRDCKIIVLTGGITGWWGAYLSSAAEVIVSSSLKNALPSWMVLDAF